MLEEQRRDDGFLLGFRGHRASLTVGAEAAFVGCLFMDSLSFHASFLFVPLYNILSFLISLSLLLRPVSLSVLLLFVH